MRKAFVAVMLLSISAGPIWAEAPTTQPANPAATNPAALEQALDQVLDVERKAYAIYSATQAKYGHVPPLPMILSSEQFHLSVLEQELKDRGLAVPPDPWRGKAADVPADRAGIYSRGVELERETIAAYDQAIAATSDPDLKDTFELLRGQSQHHLHMFSRHGGMMQGGMGGGMGRMHGMGGMGPGPMNDRGQR